MSGAELAARLTAARAALGDFRREATAALDGGPLPDWPTWAHRLAAEVATLTDTPALGTAALPGGSAILRPADVILVLAALADAVAWRGSLIGRCTDCAPGRTCDAHQGDEADQAAYRGVAGQLGDARS